MATSTLHMAQSRLRNDPAADFVWRHSRTDRHLRWLLEGVLDPRTPALGRILLLSQAEFFGEMRAPVGPKISLLFNLTGLPYLSGSIRELSRSLEEMEQNDRLSKTSDGQSAIEDWNKANSKEAKDRICAAVLEMVRRNEGMRLLTTSEQPITHLQVARELRDYEALDWTVLEDLGKWFEQFLARPKSKKAINRLTLDFAYLLHHWQPVMSQLAIALHSVNHFAGLLKKRGVNQTTWRNTVVDLVVRDLLTPYTPMFLWCKRQPSDGFVTSLPFASCPLPPLCPGCGRLAHAIASYKPFGGFALAAELKDGLLGAAIGWHLIKHSIRFRHSHTERGTETDFIVGTRKRCLLIECKMLGVTATAKQLDRTLRDAAEQLSLHEALLEETGWTVAESVCVTNLTSQHLKSLRSTGKSKRGKLPGLISFDEFTRWLNLRWLGKP